jgi:GcrA cell cycle regulator
MSWTSHPSAPRPLRRSDAARPIRPGPAAAARAGAGQPLPPQPSASEISPEALANVRETEKKARKISLMELTERTCKWPIGDPATANFWFCGLPTQAGKPYCEAHVAVAFQPMSSRRDRRR